MTLLATQLRAALVGAMSVCSFTGSATAGAPATSHEGAEQQVRVLSAPNLFSEYLGVTQPEVNAKIEAAWNQLFYGNADSERVYYETGDGMAYILDTGNNDVRSEGMSYGMMIAVQLDRQEEFDKLWHWTMSYMHHAKGPRKGFFAWQCTRGGRQLDPGSASDGEEWFATALYFASARWGDGEGIYNYREQADAILSAMQSKGEEGLGEAAIVNMFAPDAKQVRFVPLLEWAKITDPSYHVPAFYEAWAAWADHNNAFWKDAAATSRKLFRNAAHLETGLMPDYSDFEGSAYKHHGHEHFMFDAHRTLANVALDWAYFGVDEWQRKQSNRVLHFLSAYRPTLPYAFTLDGTPLTDDTATSLTAMAAVAALAADREIGEPFVRDLWEAEVPSGPYRYYNGLLYMFGLMQAGGQFHIWMPSCASSAEPTAADAGTPCRASSD